MLRFPANDSRGVRYGAAVIGLAVLGFATAAFAAEWGDFEKAFPLSPCQDGWVACVVDGSALTPDMVQDKVENGSVPQPSDLRLGFWSLKPTAAFSPFAALSEYSGAAVASSEGAASEEEVAAPEEAPAEEAPAAEEGDGSADAGSSSSGSSGSSSSGTSSGSSGTWGASLGGGSESSNPRAPTAAKAPDSSGSSGTASSGSSSGTTTSSNPRAPTAAPTPAAPAAAAAATPAAAPAATPTAPAAKLADTKPAAPAPTAPAAPSAPADCTNLSALEPFAMMGKLNDGQTGCLETAFGAAGKQTDKDKISRVLMSNAYAKGDQKEWERLIKRHLEQVDQSDPDLCYKYALHLSKGGASRQYGAIRWANVALENRFVWTGSTYTSRVFNLYKLRASAANKLWQDAEAKHAAAPTDATKKEVEDTRNQTKVFAREWYEYSKEAGKETDQALALCQSAAGTADFCKGS